MKRIICGIIAALLVLAMISPAFAATNPAPTLTATNIADTGKPYLRWTHVPGAVRYDVYKMDKSTGCEFVRLYSTKSGSHLTHSSAKRGVTYRYMVQAVGKGDTKLNSKVVVRTCDLPRPALGCQHSTHTPPRLRWDRMEGAVKYQVWVSVDVEDNWKLLYTTTNGTRLTHRSAKNDHMYFYKLRALSSNSGGHSAYSHPVGVLV